MKTNKIYDGDVKARAEKAMEMLPEDSFKIYAVILGISISHLPDIYKREGWETVAELIADINKLAWAAYEQGKDIYCRYFSELYHAACAWYQGYPANTYEEKHASEEDGSYSHVSDEDLVNIYQYLD